ncbi:MAG: NHLP family bacteriocin export ABC transporter peptidase/permease/ATPase subunit [Ruminococcus sp.]|nr:NHLP family bacteriocin export ABC transporter peptidase/permease/ATPase subunit [Ruminococcus sp.]
MPVSRGAAKVPVIMQLEALECGAASLAMIMAYYKKWIPLEQVRRDCGVSRDGSNARNVLKAARSYGMQAKGYSLDVDSIKKSGSFPCIIHWNFNHFVVLCGFRGKYAVINDPARGNIRVTMEEFDRCFTGICMMFEPTEDFTPGGSQKSTIAFARKRLTGAKAAVIFMITTMVIGFVFELISPAFSRFFMDGLLTGENREMLMPFILLFAGVGTLQIIAEAVRAVYTHRINGKMAVIGSSSYMWKVLRLPLDFFSQRMAGDIQMRRANNETIANTLIETIAPILLNAAMMIFYLVVMIRYSVMLTLIGVGTIVINAFVGRLISKKRVNITRVEQRDQGKLSSTTIAGIQMIETIKSSGSETGFFQKWAGYQASISASEEKFVKLNTYLGIIPVFLSALANTAVLVVGVYLTMQQEFTMGMIMAFQSFMGMLIMPASTLIAAGQTIQEMRTQMERVEDVMEYPDDVSFRDEPLDENKDYDKLRGSVEIKNVTFGYSKLAEPLIKDLSLTLKPGSRVAIVGASGCGKSTIAKLVSGLYQPWEGEILFDGKPMSEIDRETFTSSVAVVDQDIILFEDTIANNIKMWDNTIEDFEMKLAAHDAQIHKDIMQRAGGYQARLTEGGRDLSGGQRQRLEIARALAQEPTVLIMDEATSALDAKTEADLMEAVKKRGMTCIIIAHRLSTIRDCDNIILLENGVAEESGTHEELYARGGRYADLISND